MCKQLSLFPEEDDEEQQDKKEIDKIDLNPLFDRLAQSKFRSSFYLNPKIRSISVKRVGRRLRKAQGRLLPSDLHRR